MADSIGAPATADHRAFAQPPRRARASAAGTRRVRQLGHARARASLVASVKPPDVQEKRAQECPRVPARPSLVVLS